MLNPNSSKFYEKISVIFLAIFFVQAPVFAQDASQNAITEPKPNSSAIVRTLSISGESELKVAPDVAYFSVGIEASDADAKKAMDQAAKASEAIMTTLTDAGIKAEDIATQGVQLDLVYNGGERGIFGRPDAYHATNTMDVTVRELDTLPVLLGALADAGANSMGGLRFDISNREEREDEAMLLAVDDAKGRAQKIAKRAEVTLGKPLQIKFGNVDIDVPVVLEMADASFESAPKSASRVAVSPGLITLYSHVEMQYQLE